MQMRERLPGVRRWLIDHAPLPLLTNAHEVFLAGALLIIGGAIIVGDVTPGSITSQIPPWQALTWALFLFAGSGSTLWGLFWDRPRLEWCGQVLLGWGCAFYSAALATGIPLSRSGVVFAIFAGLSLVSFWRAFKITSQALVQRRLTEAARAAHVKVAEQRQERSAG